VGLDEVVRRGLRIAPEQEGPYITVPSGVDDRLVGEYRISVETTRDYKER
jgi:hypothetical protein